MILLHMSYLLLLLNTTQNSYERRRRTRRGETAAPDHKVFPGHCDWFELWRELSKQIQGLS